MLRDQQKTLMEMNSIQLMQVCTLNVVLFFFVRFLIMFIHVIFIFLCERIHALLFLSAYPGLGCRGRKCQ